MRIPLMMGLILSVLSLIIDGNIYLLLRSAYRQRKGLLRGYVATSIFCWIFLVAIFVFPRKNGDVSILPAMWMLYGYLTVYVSKLVFALIVDLMLIPRLWGAHLLRFGVTIATPVAVGVFLIAWWGALVGRREIQVLNYDMVSEKLPATFNGYKIVQFSDAHVGTWGNDTTFVSQFVDSINALKPDMILFTGDIVNRQSAELDPFVTVLSRLKAPDGVYSVLGNHDYGMYKSWSSDQERNADVQRLIKLQEKMGWKVLNNAHSFITKGTDTIALIGVENWGEPPFGQFGKLDKAYSPLKTKRYNQNDSLFKILMSHNPEHWNQVVSRKSNIDLTLSGHTHAMQFVVQTGKHRWSPSQYKYTQWGGHYTKNNDNGEPVNIYVNIGSGEVGMPFRIGAAPEITLITLSSSSSAK